MTVTSACGGSRTATAMPCSTCRRAFRRCSARIAPALAPALAELALGLPRASGARLAATAVAFLRDQAVSPLPAEAYQRVMDAADELGNGPLGADGPDVAPLDDDEIVDLVQAMPSLSRR